MKTADTVHAFFTAEKYCPQHAGKQQKSEDEYNKIFPFHCLRERLIVFGRASGCA